MDLERQLLFLFSALGALNGLFLSLYFAFFIKQKQRSNYFLSALLFVLSIRIIKSVFMYFNPGLSELFIQIGLSCCILIGPFLYLYVKSLIVEKSNINWLIHVLPALTLMTVLGLVYPYWTNKNIWSYVIVKGIYLQWLIYIVFTGIQLKLVFKVWFSKQRKLKNNEIWLLSIFIGVSVIWIGYNVGPYTSYIVGAFSFSFVFYLLVLFWVFKRNKNSLFFKEPLKYANKKIDGKEAKQFNTSLIEVIKEQELYKNPNLKLVDVASLLEVSTHYLSQFLNDNLGQSFSQYINTLRVEESKKLIQKSNQYTLEAIGLEAGFSSKSTFYSTFKKVTGTTPAAYKNQIS